MEIKEEDDIEITLAMIFLSKWNEKSVVCGSVHNRNLNCIKSGMQ